MDILQFSNREFDAGLCKNKSLQSPGKADSARRVLIDSALYFDDYDLPGNRAAQDL
jgi:hypothetical protein